MQWLGLAILTLALILALFGKVSAVAFGIGAGLLVVWYLFGREDPHVPPDASDFATSDDSLDSLAESSTSFDLPDLRPFLERIGKHFESGFPEKTIAHIADLAARMKHNEEKTLGYEISHGGVHAQLHIGLFKDDEEEISVYFHTTPALVAMIDSEMDSFFAELGQ